MPLLLRWCCELQAAGCRRVVSRCQLHGLGAWAAAGRQPAGLRRVTPLPPSSTVEAAATAAAAHGGGAAAAQAAGAVLSC
jgi:hypothetical protein